MADRACSGVGSAWRRMERRLHAMLRHERQTVELDAGHPAPQGWSAPPPRPCLGCAALGFSSAGRRCQRSRGRLLSGLLFACVPRCEGGGGGEEGGNQLAVLQSQHVDVQRQFAEDVAKFEALFPSVGKRRKNKKRREMKLPKASSSRVFARAARTWFGVWLSPEMCKKFGFFWILLLENVYKLNGFIGSASDTCSESVCESGCNGELMDGP